MMWFSNSRKESNNIVSNDDDGPVEQPSELRVVTDNSENNENLDPNSDLYSRQESLDSTDTQPEVIEGTLETQSKSVTNSKSKKHRSGGVALALGGGVARGWAHIGVLKAADEFGLPISMIAGTSIGALAGGSYLSGNLDALEEFAKSLTKRNILRYLDFSLSGSGLISGTRLANRMDSHMENVNIEDMDKPFVAIATDIQSGHEMWLTEGPLVPAIRASYALPGVFTPIMHLNRQLVDGALVNPVPVSACRAYEPDLVIAVNLNSESYGRATVIRPTIHDATDDSSNSEKLEDSSSWFSGISCLHFVQFLLNKIQKFYFNLSLIDKSNNTQ